MIGILILLTVSWALLYFVEKESLLALGMLPALKRLKQLGIGFAITALLCLGVQLLESSWRSSRWTFNDSLEGTNFFQMLGWDLRSVITEELVFRGAILYILIKKLGTSRGILISAIAFGIYHWFSYEVLGSIVPMVVVFLGTGLMGYAWALAFARTESIAMPIGLHLGWNFTFNTIFSNGPFGTGLLILESEKTIPDWFSLIGLWVIPVVVLLIVNRFVDKEKVEFY